MWKFRWTSAVLIHLLNLKKQPLFITINYLIVDLFLGFFFGWFTNIESAIWSQIVASISLVILSTSHHFFAGWPENDGMFKLSCVATFLITKWGVWVDDTSITQIFQCHQVLCLTKTIQPTPTKSKSAKVLVDYV